MKSFFLWFFVTALLHTACKQTSCTPAKSSSPSPKVEVLTKMPVKPLDVQVSPKRKIENAIKVAFEKDDQQNVNFDIISPIEREEWVVETREKKEKKWLVFKKSGDGVVFAYPITAATDATAKIVELTDKPKGPLGLVVKKEVSARATVIVSGLFSVESGDAIVDFEETDEGQTFVQKDSIELRDEIMNGHFVIRVVHETGEDASENGFGLRVDGIESVDDYAFCEGEYQAIDECLALAGAAPRPATAERTIAQLRLLLKESGSSSALELYNKWDDDVLVGKIPTVDDDHADFHIVRFTRTPEGFDLEEVFGLSSEDRVKRFAFGPGKMGFDIRGTNCPGVANGMFLDCEDDEDASEFITLVDSKWDHILTVESRNEKNGGCTTSQKRNYRVLNLELVNGLFAIEVTTESLETCKRVDAEPRQKSSVQKYKVYNCDGEWKPSKECKKANIEEPCIDAP